MEKPQKRQVFVSGLPYTTTIADLKQFLVDKCEIEESDFVTVKIPSWQDSGKSKGYAIVTFANEESFDKSFKADKESLGSRYIDIKPAKTESKVSKQIDLEKLPENCCTLFIKNLPYELKEKEVEDKFSEYGDITNVRLGRWAHTGNLKGFGFIDFKHPTTLRRIIKLQNTGTVFKLKERSLICDFEPESTPKQSFRNEQGVLWSKANRKRNTNSDGAKRRKARKLN